MTDIVEDVVVEAEGAAAGTVAGGKVRDLTQGPIGRTLIMFALPTLFANVLQSLNASINMVWIGRFLGESALAATSNATNVIFLAFSATFGFGMSATILVGQNMGRRDIDGARRAVGAAVGLFLCMSVVVTIGGLLLTDRLLHLMATPPDAIPLASAYLKVMFLTMPASFIMVLMMMALRGAGDSLTPLWFMIVGLVLDAGLNPFFIAGIGPFPKLGIAGSAVATLIANSVGLIGIMIVIYARDLPIRLRGAEFRYLIPPLPLLKLIVGKGLVMAAQMFVFTLSGLLMLGMVNHTGVATTAAYGVALQIWNYVQMPSMAVGAAVSAMAAQNIGAGRWDRVSQITNKGLIYNLILTTVLVALITVFDRAALGLFLGPDSPAMPIAQHIQYIAGGSFIISGMMLVLFGTVRANGAVIGPLIVMFLGLVVGRAGFAFFGRHWLGQDALWWSFPFGSTVVTILAWAYYLKAPWRKVALADVAQRAEHGDIAQRAKHADGH